jgi:hypothetical protein
MLSLPRKLTMAAAAASILGAGAPALAQTLNPMSPALRPAPVDVEQSRPKSLIPLYSTLAVLQGADALYTVRGLKGNADELNPLMRGNGAVMTLTKTLATATTIALAEKMWKRNRTAAVATVIAANAVTAAVVLRNARVVSATAR